jgi:CheY-like chemotaxis protein
MAQSHILIVDDEPRVAAFLGETLAHASPDMYISTARSGEEAQGIMRESRVDLLVTDVRMPGIDGVELLRWAKSTSPDIRTILMTAYEHEMVAQKVEELGVDRMIEKPFDVVKMSQAIVDMMDETPVAHTAPSSLPQETYALVAGYLESCRLELNALAVFLADMQGNRLAEAGDAGELDVGALLALLSGSFATNQEIAHRFGNGAAADLNFHQGSAYEFYSATLGNGLFLTVVYDRRIQPSSIGIVWLYVRRTMDKLRIILERELRDRPVRIREDFQASLSEELDRFFPTDRPFPFRS